MLDPQLTGAGRGKHGSSAAADGNSGADSSADVVSRALPDPAEAARRILHELGRCGSQQPVCLLVTSLLEGKAGFLSTQTHTPVWLSGACNVVSPLVMQAYNKQTRVLTCWQCTSTYTPFSSSSTSTAAQHQPPLAAARQQQQQQQP